MKLKYYLYSMSTLGMETQKNGLYCPNYDGFTQMSSCTILYWYFR